MTPAAGTCFTVFFYCFLQMRLVNSIAAAAVTTAHRGISPAAPVAGELSSLRLFEERRAGICASAPNKWEEVHIALGIAIYDPELDSSVSDAVRRADKIMYENKRIAKSKKH